MNKGNMLQTIALMGVLFGAYGAAAETVSEKFIMGNLKDASAGKANEAALQALGVDLSRFTCGAPVSETELRYVRDSLKDLKANEDRSGGAAETHGWFSKLKSVVMKTVNFGSDKLHLTNRPAKAKLDSGAKFELLGVENDGEGINNQDAVLSLTYKPEGGQKSRRVCRAVVAEAALQLGKSEEQLLKKSGYNEQKISERRDLELKQRQITSVSSNAGSNVGLSTDESNQTLETTGERIIENSTAGGALGDSGSDEIRWDDDACKGHGCN